MAINLIAQTTLVNDTSTFTSRTVTVSGEFKGGDIAILLNMPNTASVPVPPIPGWTRVIQESPGFNALHFFYKVLEEDSTSVSTGSFSSTYSNWLGVYRGYVVKEAAFQQSLPVSRALLPGELILLPFSGNTTGPGSGYVLMGHTYSSSYSAYMKESLGGVETIPSVTQYGLSAPNQTFIILGQNNALDAPKELVPNDDIVNVTSIPRFSWTYSDPDSDPQDSYELNYRVIGTDEWETVGIISSTNSFHDFSDVSVFEIERGHEWRVRVSDGSEWSDWSESLKFIPSYNEWVYTEEIISSESVHTLAANTLESSKVYYYEVRTSDDENGFGPWSESAKVGLPGGLWYQDRKPYEVVVDGIIYDVWIEVDGQWVVSG